MGTVEIVLLVIGIICVIVGIILGLTDNNEKEATESSASDYDAASQVSQVAQTIDSIIEKKMQDIEDKTEARLDKISNTKILEMNEYADGVLKEINRNHNEVMFMYDMLNEKDKEIKTTVKDVNVTRMNRGYAYNDAKQQSAMEEPKIVMQDIEDFVLDESLSTHDKIRKLYSNGYNNDVEIAKRLKIGVGEVRLVINLSSGNN
jgi:thioesterase domain-containing protein